MEHGNRFKDRTGERHGSMVVLELIGKVRNNKDTLWKCQCDCGKIVFKTNSLLTKVKTCGDKCTVGVSTTETLSVNNPENELFAYGLVYKLTNTIDGKIYIGQTIFSVQERWNKHIEYALKRNGDGHLQRAIRVYGPEAFTQEAIDFAADKNHLDYLEKYHINAFNALDPDYGYNQTWRPVRSDEANLKTSEKQLGELNHYYRDDLIGTDIKTLYESGQSLSQIAKQYNTTHHTIAVRLRSLGVDIKRQPAQKDLPMSEVCNKYLTGKSLVDLATEYNISYTVIREKILKEGIVLRKPSTGKGNGLKRKDVTTEALAAQFKAGLTLSQLSRVHKMDRKTIRYRLQQAGIETRKNVKQPGEGWCATSEADPQSSNMDS